MTKRVSETLSEIKVFLQGKDQSDSPRFRELAAEYSAACADVAQELEQCRAFFNAGTPLNAYRLNLQKSPTLTERFRMLRFPDCEKWISLCRLYQLDVPPAMDEEIIRKLTSDEQLFRACDTEELLKLWRKVARTGALEDKMQILRQLMNVAGERSEWEKNLQKIEKVWLNEQFREAENAFRDGDGKRLCEIYDRCTSPALLHPAKEADFHSFREMMETWRRQDFAKKQQELLRQIDDAYSLMDEKTLEHLMPQWDAISSSPYFTTDESRSRQIENARSFYEERKAAAELQRHFEETKAKLEQQMENGEPVPELNKTFFLLQQTGIPVDKVIVRQMENRNEEYQLDARRRHIRICFFGFLLVMVLGGAGYFLFFRLQIRHEISILSGEWEQKWQSDPETVIRSFSEISRTKPAAVSMAAELIALRDKALHRKKEISEEREMIRQKTESLQKNFPSPDMPAREEAAALLKFLQEHRQQGTPEQRQAIDDLETRFQHSFRDACTAAGKNVDALMLPLNDEESVDLKSVREKSAEMSWNLDQLHPEGISKENSALLKAQKQKAAALEKRIAEVEAYQHSREELYQAASATAFFARLQFAKDSCPKLWARFGLPAAGQQQLLNDMASCANRAASASGAKKVSASSGNPYIEFCLKLMPESDDLLPWIQKEAELCAKERYRTFSLTLPSDKGEVVFCLKQPAVEVERTGGKKLGGAITALSFPVLLPDGTEKKMQCTVKRNEKKEYFLYPVQGPKFYFPEKIPCFGPLNYEEISRWEKGVPRTGMMLFWEELSRVLAQMSSFRVAESYLLDEITALEGKSLDPLQKRQIIGELLILWGKCSWLNETMARRMRAVLHWNSRDPWMLPAADNENLRKAAQENIDAFYRKFAVMKKNWQICQNLLRTPPVPAGILILEKGKINLHFFKGHFDSSSALFVMSGNAFIPVSRSWKNESVSSLSEALREAVFNGQLFFSFPEEGRERPDFDEMPDFLVSKTFWQLMEKGEKR